MPTTIPSTTQTETTHPSSPTCTHTSCHVPAAILGNGPQQLDGRVHPPSSPFLCPHGPHRIASPGHTRSRISVHHGMYQATRHRTLAAVWVRAVCGGWDQTRPTDSVSALERSRTRRASRCSRQFPQSRATPHSHQHAEPTLIITFSHLHCVKFMDSSRWPAGRRTKQPTATTRQTTRVASSNFLSNKSCSQFQRLWRPWSGRGVRSLSSCFAAAGGSGLRWASLELSCAGVARLDVAHSETTEAEAAGYRVQRTKSSNLPSGTLRLSE